MTFTLESVTCPECLVMFDQRSAAGTVRLEPWGYEHEVVATPPTHR